MRLILKKFFRKNAVFVAPFILGILMVFISLQFLIPTIESIVDLRGLKKEKEEQLVQLKKKRTLLESLDVSEIETNVTEAEIALPSEKNIGSMFVTLENLSVKTGMGVDLIDTSPGVLATTNQTPEGTEVPVRNEKNGAFWIPMEVTALGTTEQLRQFLNDLAISRRIVDIENIKINYLQNSEDFLSAQFLFQVYYLPAITQIGSLVNPIVEFTEEELRLFSVLKTFPDYSSTLLTTASGSGEIEVVGKTNLFN